MQEGFQFADLIFLAAVAGFVLWKLRATLGKRDGFEGPTTPATPREVENGSVITLPAQSVALEPEEDLALATGGNDAVAAGLEAIRAKDANFNRKRFLHGAKVAFEMVMDAFSKGDRRALQGLLAPALYAKFEKEMDRRQQAGEVSDITLVSVDASEITQASLTDHVARIGVRFNSEQIALTRNASGAVVSGSPSQIDRVIDVWTFERDTRNANPNWTVIDT